MSLEWNRPKPTATALRSGGRRKFCKMLIASTTLWLVRSSSGLALRSRLPASAFVKNVSQPVVIHGGEVPLVRIDLIEGKSQEYRAQVSDIAYQTLVDVLSVPEHDRFHVITEHPKGGLPFDRDYLGIHRTDNCIFFQITLNSGRSAESKQAFTRRLPIV
jgi:4-oxalocrotonate tautomerase